QANRDQAYAGSTAAQIQAARSSVLQAQVSVANAQKGVDDTKLVAPFDGTVAALNIQVGDLAGASSASGASSTAAIVLNTPSRLVLNLTIAETDYPSVKAGDTGVVTFSALTGEAFPFVIDALGANPVTTQGVVTYQATAHLATGMQALEILRSMSSFGGRGTRRAAAGASGTPGAATTPRAARTPQAAATPGASAPQGGGSPFGGGGVAQAIANQPQPAPGMSATATIIVDQRTNVVMVPLKAVQTKNRQSVVTVKNADGTTHDVTVTTGLSDATNTEITSGLTEGQTIEIPGAVTTTTTTQALPATGGRGGGGFFVGPGGARGGG
ncbi:MAG TPA: HlyD family efflux transporter periplasmic adaptor subunit, partial [Dehalococcoidia bacterium]|nr:HlyD family efflux transporter periplasmic adaptor subunit [Dehalococcoidia bacterium]